MIFFIFLLYIVIWKKTLGCKIENEHGNNLCHITIGEKDFFFIESAGLMIL